MTVLLVSGIPATGKTTFCDWLGRHHGYLAINGDQPEAATTLGLLHGGVDGPRRALDHLRSAADLVAFEYGFSPGLVGDIRRFIAAGADAWWFDGDHPAARESFIRRSTVPLEALRTQMNLITVHWGEIASVFAGRIIEVVGSGPTGPTYLRPDDIFERIQTARL